MEKGYNMKQETAIRGAAFLLNEIEVYRTHPGKGQKAPTSIVYCGRLPADLVEEFKALPGYQNHNLEKAMRLLLTVRAGTRTSGVEVPETDNKPG